MTQCATGDCDRAAVVTADIYDGENPAPIRTAYCGPCACVLAVALENVQPITAEGEVMAHVQTYGERIQALETERQRYRSALRDLLGWIPVDQPEHLRVSRLLQGAPPEEGPFRFRDNARKGQR